MSEGKVNGKDNLLSLALGAHKAGKLVEAENFYLQFLKSHPDHYAALDLLGILYAQREEYEEAITYFYAALKIQPDSANCLNHLGNALSNLGENQQAIEKFEQALALHQNYAEAYNNLANVYVKEKRFENAVANYQKALSLKPNYTDACNNLATTFLKMGKMEEASQYFHQALGSEANNPLAHHHLGNIAYEKNDLEIAKHHFDQVLKYLPDHTDTLVNRSAVALKQGEKEVAVDYLNKVLAIAPQHILALTNLAAIYFSEGNFEEAKRHYYDLLVLDPDYYTAHFNLAVMYMEQKKWHQAQIHLHHLVTYYSQSKEVHINYAAVLLKLKHKEQAILQYQEALKLEPNNLSVQYILSALTGSTTPHRAPEDYLISLFDQYAGKFDKELLENLQYKTPQLLKESLLSLLLPNQFYTILDLGCGTGLCGEQFKSGAKKIVGIDISPKMIAVCKAKAIYDELIVADLIKGFQQLNEKFQIILAADVLVYFGHLEDLFETVFQRLEEKGLFAFSIEKGDTYPFALQETGRYAHHPNYINQISLIGQLKIEKEVVLRKQEDREVIGILYVFEKN